MSGSPFGDALAQLGRSGARGGLLVRYDFGSGDLKAAIAVKALDSKHVDMHLGAEFTLEKATKRPAGFVGVEFTFD